MLNEAKYLEVVTSTSPTVTGYLSESAKKIAAKKNSFHTLMKLMDAATAMPGIMSGPMMYCSVCRSEAPSTDAAWSNSIGMAAKNPRRMKM